KIDRDVVDRAGDAAHELGLLVRSDLVVHASEGPAARVVRDAVLDETPAQTVLHEPLGVPRPREESPLVGDWVDLDSPHASDWARVHLHADVSESFRHTNASAYPVGEAASMPRI